MKTISIESTKIPCPINNGADLKADNMLENLFDDAQYVENHVGDGGYIALGFIDGVPARCSYVLGCSFLWVAPVLKKSDSDYGSWKKMLPERLSDGQVCADLTYFGNGGWYSSFYYRDEINGVANP